MTTLLLSWLLAAPAFDVDVRARDYIDRYFGTTGVVVVVLRDGKASFHHAGRASKDEKIGLGKDTIFEIGSITKVFTALLLQQAVDAGRVKFDTPVADLLPKDVSFPRSITLEHLSTHRSGLPRLPGNQFKTALGPLTERGNPYADYDEKRLYAWARTYKAKTPPGGKVRYSNLGVGLLGHVLARSAGLSYAELLQRDVLGPLKMNSTGVTVSDPNRGRFADGHGGWGGQTGHWDFQTMAPAGALRSSAEDMLRFLLACVGVGPPKLVAALKRTHAARHDTRKGKIGLGWFRNKLDGRMVVWHNGGTGGFRSYLGFLEGTSSGVVVLGNSSTPVEPVAHDVLGVLGGPPPSQ